MGPQAVILDAEALNAMAHASQRPVLADRTRAILHLAYENGAHVRVPAPVLAEVCRGVARDAAVDRVLRGRGIEVIELSARIARHAGALLARTKLGSLHAVDAFVVATAASFGSAIIATGDVQDLRKLAANLPHVSVLRI